MEITIQDGREVTITDLMLGVNSELDAVVLTVSSIPTIGNINFNGAEMDIGGTLTVAQIRAGMLTYAAYSGVLGNTNFSFNSGDISLDIVVVIGQIGVLYIMAKVTPPVLTLVDSIPREIPALLANKLAHEVAARMLERGDRKSDDVMAMRARQKFNQAKLDTLSAINNFGGAFDSIQPI